MTKEQADEMLSLLKDIRGLLARVANGVSKDGRFIFYSEPFGDLNRPTEPPDVS